MYSLRFNRWLRSFSGRLFLVFHRAGDGRFQGLLQGSHGLLQVPRKDDVGLGLIDPLALNLIDVARQRPEPSEITHQSILSVLDRQDLFDDTWEVRLAETQSRRGNSMASYIRRNMLVMGKR